MEWKLHHHEDILLVEPLLETFLVEWKQVWPVAKVIAHANLETFLVEWKQLPPATTFSAAEP